MQYTLAPLVNMTTFQKIAGFQRFPTQNLARAWHKNQNNPLPK
jgi:hypothetical protein